MEKNQVRWVLSGAMLLALPMFAGPAAYAAKPMDMSLQPLSVLSSFAAPSGLVGANAVGIKETKRRVDFKNTLHVRIQQTYAGYPVFGADAVVHLPKGGAFKNRLALSNVMSMARSDGSMNGLFFQGLQADLAGAPSELLSKEQSQKALRSVISDDQHRTGVATIAKDQQSQLMVFVDKDNKAHWAYQVSFTVEPVKAGELPSKPVKIVDAKTFEVYAEWNNIKTMGELGDAFGGGFGGNKKMGQLSYDGLSGELHLEKLPITHDAAAKKCLLKNRDVNVKSYRTGSTMSYKCDIEDGSHNGVFWNGDIDQVNDGYSPMNDAMSAGMVLKEMYLNWYKVPVLVEEDGRPMMLNMVVHDPIDNAFWDGRQMTFGDGVNMFYPLTSLGVGAHEVSHGFTEQNSNLSYYGQSGGMNEAYSDMAAQAAEYFSFKKNSWQIGPEIFKEEGQALRYMDQPTKDCRGKEPGNWCSIDNAKDYYSGLDVHFSSGVYNRAFYLIGTSPGWDTRKAFDIMVHANQNYWVSSSTFASGACDVLSATKDLSYDIETVQNAFAAVGIDTTRCKASVPRSKSDNDQDKIASL